MTRSRPQQKTLTTPELVVRAMPDAMPSITITTDAVDAMQDRIKQDGLTFRDPLPVLFGHDHREIPVGQSRRAWVTRTPHRTTAAWRWLEGDDQAARVKNAFDQHFLAASVGMVVEEAERNDVGGYDILRATVIEFSLTAVPANPDCVRLLKDLAMWDAGHDPVVLYLDDDGADDDTIVLSLKPEERFLVTPEDIADAFSVVVREATRRELDRLRGRIHDPEAPITVRWPAHRVGCAPGLPQPCGDRPARPARDQPAPRAGGLMHPLVDAIRRNAQNEDQWAQAQQAADHLEPILAEALACTEPDQARALLAAAIVALYESTRPYVGLTPAQGWIDETHRQLHARARELFGADGWHVVPPPHHEPLPARPAGPRSMFGV